MTTPSAISLAAEVCVILVEPSESLNIGLVARAMKNLGFPPTSFGRPSRLRRQRARVTACWSEDILDAVEIAPDLPSALLDLSYVVGLSGRGGKNRLKHLLELEPFLSRATERLSRGEKLGVVLA